MMRKVSFLITQCIFIACAAFSFADAKKKDIAFYLSFDNWAGMESSADIAGGNEGTLTHQSALGSARYLRFFRLVVANGHPHRNNGMKDVRAVGLDPPRPRPGPDNGGGFRVGGVWADARPDSGYDRGTAHGTKPVGGDLSCYTG